MNYNLEYIEKLRIHELRDYARKLGVGRPTTLKKKELISSIFDIISQKGLEKNESGVSSQDGLDFFALLTAENSNILSDLLSLDKDNDKSKSTMLIKKNSAEKEGFLDINNIEPFAYSIGQNPAKYSNDSVSDVSGYVDIHPNGYGILRCDGFVPNDNDAFFTTALVKKYNLKKGMFITGNAKYIIEGKPRVVYEILTIQDKNILKNADNFDNINANGLGDGLYLDKHNLSIKLGERHYIENLTLNDAVNLSYDIVEENGVYVKFVNIKSRPEEYHKSNGKLEIINVPFNKTELEVLNTIELVIERVKREFEIGKSNVVILYNFCELIRYVNLAYEGCYECNKFNAKTINKIDNILYTAKYVSKDSSCTIICVDRNGVTKDMKEIMECEFLPLFNQIHKSVESKK